MANIPEWKRKQMEAEAAKQEKLAAEAKAKQEKLNKLKPVVFHTSVPTETAGERTRKKALTRWANTYLIQRTLKIEDLYTDLRDGLMLHNLLEILSSQKIPLTCSTPSNRLDQMNNLKDCLKFLVGEGLIHLGKDQNTRAEKILEGTRPFQTVLELMVAIADHYQIKVPQGSTPLAELSPWVTDKIPHYGKHAFYSLFAGEPLCALVNAVQPGLINLPNDLTGTQEGNTHLALTKAHSNFNIPLLCDASDMTGANYDEWTSSLYISYLRDVTQKQEETEAAELASGNIVITDFKPSHAHTRASGPGVKSGGYIGDLVRGEVQFTVTSRNDKNQPIPTDAGIYYVSVQWTEVDVGRHKIPHAVEQGTNGIVVKYSPVEDAQYEITVNFDRYPIQGSPFFVQWR